MKKAGVKETAEAEVCACVYMYTSKESKGAMCFGGSISDVFIPLGPGSCEEVKLHILRFIEETEEIVLASNSSQFPLGESFLAAKGIWLTSEELALPRLSPSWETVSEKFLSGNDYAIRLAAQSSKCHALPISSSI